VKRDLRDNPELRRWAESWTPLPAVADMLIISVGRIVSRHGGWQAIWGLESVNPGAISHIVDWLTADYLAGAAWIDRVDSLGRPLKLMKCGSIERLLHEAEKAMRKRLQGAVAALGEGDEITVATLRDGYTVVRLMTPRALDVESKRMRHCVGHGAYDEPLERGTIEIYSLRDPDGRPLITMEVALDNLTWDETEGDFRTRPLEGSGRTVEQIQGPGNGRPPNEHLDVLRVFLARSGWSLWQEWYRWDGREDWTGFVDHLLAIADNQEREDGIQPR